eukprot:314977-Chlamydomonas_euryale.AAC.1
MVDMCGRLGRMGGRAERRCRRTCTFPPPHIPIRVLVTASQRLAAGRSKTRQNAPPLNRSFGRRAGTPGCGKGVTCRGAL